jgi:hypothetical protein
MAALAAGFLIASMPADADAARKKRVYVVMVTVFPPAGGLDDNEMVVRIGAARKQGDERTRIVGDDYVLTFADPSSSSWSKEVRFPKDAKDWEVYFEPHDRSWMVANMIPKLLVLEDLAPYDLEVYIGPNRDFLGKVC